MVKRYGLVRWGIVNSWILPRDWAYLQHKIRLTMTNGMFIIIHYQRLAEGLSLPCLVSIGHHIAPCTQHSGHSTLYSVQHTVHCTQYTILAHCTQHSGPVILVKTCEALECLAWLVNPHQLHLGKPTGLKILVWS